MSNEKARQEAKPQTIEVTSPVLIDSEVIGKKESLHILHVDDDVSLLEVSKQILSMENNFQIDTALSVDEAFRKMEKQSYDVVVSDYEMPLKNGLDFLRELREQNREMPFILFTGKGREDVAVKALNLGADRYINKNGSPETVYCELTDAINKTVERKKSRQLLAKSESKYRTLVEKSLQGILVALIKPIKHIFANSTIEKMLGYSYQELMSLSPEEIRGLVYPEDRAVFFKRTEDRLNGEPATSCNEFRAVRKDGSLIWLSGFFERVDYDGQPAIMGIFLDISESKKNEENLRKSEQRYRELANFLPGVIFERDLDNVTIVNQRAFDMTGYTPDELKFASNMLLFVLPEDQERVMENLKKIMIGEDLGIIEFTLLRKNGTTFPALIMISPTISENKVTGFRGMVIDITERKKTEEALNQTMNKLAMVNEKLSVVGSLTRHDVSNKLSAVNGYTYLLKKKHADQADIVDQANKIEQAVKDSEKIFEFAKMYEQLGVEELTFIDVEAKLKEACSLFSGPLPQIINECQGLTVLADSSLRQLFYNFIDNTRKYGKKTTTIRVHFKKAGEDSLKLVFEDDGVGVSFENKTSLFKEGFSTGGSTGFGLFLSKKMMDVYGWEIEENGEPGKGAKFTMTIPKFNKNGKETFQIKSKTFSC